MGKHKHEKKKHKREKKHKSKKKHRKHSSSASSSSESEAEWVEKCKSLSDDEEKPVKTNYQNEPCSSKRDDWMSISTSFSSFSNIDRQQSREENKRIERENSKYNPKTCPRELNPYWKDGGDGLPKFKKPCTSDDETSATYNTNYKRVGSTSNWRKKPTTENKEINKKEMTSNSNKEDNSNQSEQLSDKELNILASKLVKAEIMGNTKLINELKEKLENARKGRNSTNQQTTQEEVILTETDSLGRSRPLKSTKTNSEFDNKRKKQKVDTHSKSGERVRYFADDDKYSLKEMFQNEKFHSIEDQNIEFAKMAGKIRKNDDLDDVFSDNIRNKESDAKTDARIKSKAINEHQRVTNSLDNCKRCLQSDVMPKHLMISMGETVYLSLPPHEPLTDGHCLIIPIRHVSCATQLDENEWSEILDFRRALTQLFKSRDEDVIFFERAVAFHKYPHMMIECVPLPIEEGEMAPIYFKKAIDESEIEWTQNKKLISMKNKDVRRSVPKGLSYFSVSFGMDEGYAHVIEDEKLFPNNFAQEIIGGMLDLHHSKWRKPKLQSFEEQSQRAVKFSQDWASFDCTNK